LDTGIRFAQRNPANTKSFSACRAAYHELALQRTDLPCDVSCGADILDCIPSTSPSGSSKSSVCDCVSACDTPIDFKKLSKRAKRIWLSVVVVFVFIATYLFYGRGIDTIYVTDLGRDSGSVFT